MKLKMLNSLWAIQGDVDDLSPLDFLTLMAMPEETSFFRSDSFRSAFSLKFLIVAIDDALLYVVEWLDDLC